MWVKKAKVRPGLWYPTIKLTALMTPQEIITVIRVISRRLKKYPMIPTHQCQPIISIKEPVHLAGHQVDNKVMFKGNRVKTSSKVNTQRDSIRLRIEQLKVNLLWDT